MTGLGKLRQDLLWKYYYRYRRLCEHDSEGGYSLLQKAMMFANFTKVNLFGEYWTEARLQEIVDSNPNTISKIIYDKLNGEAPCMIARYGANEQRIVANYLAITSSKRNLMHVITGKSSYWWWNKMLRKELNFNAGFFPNEASYVEKYSKLMLDDTRMLDVLLTWFGWEPLILGSNHSISLVSLYEAEPWWQASPWTKCLSGKKVLVIHPFAELIESQYERRSYLFENKDVLPEFDLKTIKAVQSISGKSDDFNDWFEALDWMKRRMDETDYDIALIGCGAYGFCLAAHAKRRGKKAFHMGGVLQLLFGIKGKRWEQKDYHPKYDYTSLFNEYWVKPDASLKPKKADDVENGCYW